MREVFSKIKQFLNSKGFAIFVISLAVVIMFSQADHRFGYTSSTEKENTCIITDGTGYYIYLPQYIVYPDSTNFTFTKHLANKYPGSRFFEMLSFDDRTQKVRSKFYSGTAILQLPFYWLTHKIHQWNSWEADGYSLGYRFSIQLAALFYWVIGIIALFRLFGRLGFQRFAILLGIIIITFGTNLNYYTSFYVTMSHVYSFAMISCFLNVAHLWATKQKDTHFFWMLLLIGIIGVLRPVNILVVLMLPFFFDSLKGFWESLRELFVSKIYALTIGIFLLLIPIVIQLFVQFDQSRTLSLYTYVEEGFANAFTPQFWNVLFSYHKGFFIYAPVMFILFIGLYFFIRYSSRYFSIGWFTCTAIWLYVICSWWCWDYGGGLGMRALIEMLPLFLFPILYLFKFGNRIVLILSSVVIIGGVYFYQLFQIQFNNDIISCCKMDKENFWNVFMKTDKRYRWMVDYDEMRESLPSKDYQIRFLASLENHQWKVIENKDSLKIQPSEFESIYYLNYFTQPTDVVFKGRFKGKVKLNDKDGNPFINIRYLNENQLVEESVFTIGSLIDTPYSFQSFELEVNHELKNKSITRIEFVLNNVDTSPTYKNFVFENYK